jgi:hypothetical protein
VSRDELEMSRRTPWLRFRDQLVLERRNWCQLKGFGVLYRTNCGVLEFPFGRFLAAVSLGHEAKVGV